MGSLHGSMPRNDEMKHAIRVGEGCVTAQSQNHWVDSREAEHLISS